MFSKFFSSGTTHTICSLSGTNSGTTAVATIEWVSLYAYAGSTHGAGVKLASTRRINSNTAWGDIDNLVINESGANTPTFFWDNGTLKLTTGGSVQITARIKLTWHNCTNAITY